MASILFFKNNRPLLKPLNCDARSNNFPVTCHFPTRWGTDKVAYGGVGGAASCVFRQGGVVSRGHRHYGTGIINCYSPRQPYRLTDLLLSNCRPYDQLLPPPLITDKIIHHKQCCKYPTNHTYTSHRSKFAVFPLALPSQRQSSLQDTRNDLDVHRQLFSTTTYNKTYRNHWEKSGGDQSHVTSHMTTTGDDNENKRVNDEATSDKMDDITLKSGDEILDTYKCEKCVEIFSFDYGTICSSCGYRRCDDSDNSSVSQNSKRETDSPQPESCTQEMANDAQCEELSNRCLLKHSEPNCSTTDTTTAGNDAVKESLVSGKQQKRVRWKDQAEVVGEDSDEEKVTKSEVEKQDNVEESETSKRGRSTGALTANSLPQLPHHFRRVSAKYCRNKLSPIWPCTIPFYLQRPHSILPTYIPSTHNLLGENSESEKETAALPANHNEVVEASEDDGEQGEMIEEGEQEMATSDEKADRSDMGCKALAVLARETPSVPPLSAMLHVSGSRVPHRLGVRFRTQAHTRFHQLFPDSVPDLRESRSESKRYFFYQYHSSVFRGS